MVRVHRLVYEELVGPIADGAVLMHSCANRRCVKPNHLTPGTVQDNAIEREIRKYA